MLQCQRFRLNEIQLMGSIETGEQRTRITSDPSCLVRAVILVGRIIHRSAMFSSLLRTSEPIKEGCEKVEPLSPLFAELVKNRLDA
jgi:hypothetical protein